MTTRLSSAAWAQIQTEYISGTTAAVLAVRHGIKPNTIHRRSWQENWTTPDAPPLRKTALDRLEQLADRFEELLVVAERKPSIT